MKKQTLTTIGVVLVLTFANAASAATPQENRGVIGGALIGALTGGPVGLIVGAAVGGHYAHQREQATVGAQRVAQLQDELTAVSARLAASSVESARIGAALEARKREVRMQSQRIDALLEDQALLSALGLDVRFATDDARLTQSDQRTLEILARYLARHPERRVRLHGHADARGELAHNDKLSLARSHAVAEALKAASVAPQQIDVLAYGEREATAPASDPDRLAAERKVAVELVQPDSDGRSAASAPR